MITNKHQIKIPQALLSLYPGAQWTCYGDEYEDMIWDDSNEIPKPDKTIILNEIERLKQEYERNKYQRLRMKEYPSITDQLDTLYHEGYEGWKAKIDEIKMKYPKPPKIS
jgi:hypothetical protein